MKKTNHICNYCGYAIKSDSAVIIPSIGIVHVDCAKLILGKNVYLPSEEEL